MNSNPYTSLRIALLPIALAASTSIAWAQPVTKQPMAAPTAATAAKEAKEAKVGESRYLRASQLIGKNVQGAEQKNIGEISDLVIDLSTGDVRFVMFEYDPSIFKTGKLYAVPLKDLKLAADGKTMAYPLINRQQLDRVATDKKDWKAALANTQYLDAVDNVYGVKRETTTRNLQRASELIGRDVNSREGKDIGDVQDLVIDMQTSKVRYAVLAFDPSIFSAEKMFAFSLTAFKPGRDNDELVLDVNRQRVEAMKSFDKSQWTAATDIRSIVVNSAP